MELLFRRREPQALVPAKPQFVLSNRYCEAAEDG